MNSTTTKNHKHHQRGSFHKTNRRYSVFLDMLENGKSEDEVRRTMDIHGFTEKEIRSLLNGDSVGPHAIPAPGVFSDLKTGSPAQKLAHLHTVLKNDISNAIARDELEYDMKLTSKSLKPPPLPPVPLDDESAARAEYKQRLETAASPKEKRQIRREETERRREKIAREKFEHSMKLAKTFKQKREVMESELRRNAKRKVKSQQRLQSSIEKKVGASPSSQTKTKKYFSPIKDFEERVKQAKKNDEELGRTERELTVARKTLESKMKELLDIRKQIENLDTEASGNVVKSKKLLSMLKQVLEIVCKKKDGALAFSENAQSQFRESLFEPLDLLYVRNGDVDEYIRQKIRNMENILPTWPELEEQTGQSKSSSPSLKSRGFSVWTEKELQAVLNSTPGHMGSLRKEGELQTIVGMYRRHVVAEPPQPASKYTRTVQIETPGGEFFMLGVYHRVDGIRSESEIRRFNNKVVKIKGIPHESSPKDQSNKNDILSLMTPYISSIHSIELAE